MINLADPNTLAILKSAIDADQEYKRDYHPVWEVNLRRMSGDYVQDLKDEERVFGRAGNRRLRVAGHRRTPLFAILPIANPKMHFSIARQVMNSLDFGAISTSHSRKDRLAAIGTDRMLKSRLGEQGGQDYEQAYSLALALKCALPGFMLVEGDPTKPRPKYLNETESQRGDVIVKAMPAWRVIWEPGVTDVSQMSWVVTEEFMTPHEINRRWPGDDNEAILNDEQSYVNLGELDILHDMEHGLEHSMIRVHRLWIAPSDMYPNGAQRVIIGKKYVKKVYKDRTRTEGQSWKDDAALTPKVLDGIRKMFSRKPKESKKISPEEEWVGTPDNGIPLIRFGGMPSSLTSLGRGQMDQIGSLQRLVNRKFTAYTEVSNTTPDMYILTPTNMQNDRLHNDVVFISHSSKIAGQGFEIQLRPSLKEWLDEIGWCNSMMDQILGQPGGARGEVSGSRMAGTTLQKSKEFASEMEGPENAAFNTSMAATEKRIILEGREVWPKEFIYKSIGESRKASYKVFKVADLTSIIDVEVARTDPFPKDKFNRARAIATLQKDTMIFGDPAADPKASVRMRDAMKIPSTEEDDRHEHFQDELVDKHMQALRSNPDLPVEWVCDDEYHLIEESEYLAELVASDEADDEFQKNVAIHIIYHQINKARKDKWLSITSASEKIAEQMQASVALDNLSPEEMLAMSELQAEEQGAPEMPAQQPMPMPMPMPGGMGM